MRHDIMRKNILGNLHVIINIVLLSICILFCIIFTFAVDKDIAKNFLLAFFVSIAILLIFNILMILLVIFQRKKINETLQVLFGQEDYSNAREYLDKWRSKIVMPAVYQILLYYSGYVELLDNNIEKGKQFLKSFKIDKQYRMNSLFVVFCMFLLYFIYLYEEDECGLVAIREKYYKYKTSLFKTISSNEEAKLAIETIEYFENNQIKEGVKHLRVSRFYKLYLWVYAHHKVIYYANFLIPIISKELAKHCGQKTFPSWALDYSDLSKLDDYYIWTAMKAFLCDTGRKNKNEKYCNDLILQLLSRRYYISLYKSLAEFELVFASFTEKQRIQAFNKMFKQVDKSKPLLEKTGRKKEYLAGYINSEGLNEINKEIRGLYGLPNDSTEMFIDEMLFVVTEFKQKFLDTDKVYLDMGDEKLSISQIPLLVNDGHVSNSKNQNKYFYIYYKENERLENLNKENFKRFMKEALKNYLVK